MNTNLTNSPLDDKPSHLSNNQIAEYLGLPLKSVEKLKELKDTIKSTESDSVKQEKNRQILQALIFVIDGIPGVIEKT